jgi:hypothetical protein
MEFSFATEKFGGASFTFINTNFVSVGVFTSKREFGSRFAQNIVGKWVELGL